MNVTEATLQFYAQTFISVRKHVDFSEEGLKRWVVGSREAGNAPRSITPHHWNQCLSEVEEGRNIA